MSDWVGTHGGVGLTNSGWPVVILTNSREQEHRLISPFAVRGGQISVEDAAAIEDVGFVSLSALKKRESERKAKIK